MGWVLTKSLDRKAEILVTFTASLCNIPEYAGNPGSLLEPIKRASGSACHVGQRRFCRSAMSGRLFMADGWPASQDRRTTPYGNRGWPKTVTVPGYPRPGDHESNLHTPLVYSALVGFLISWGSKAPRTSEALTPVHFWEHI
jgi:hypothetical protein